ncbi:MAG TPA: TonB-dependent receptor [Vicinamibacterales bacterium]|nr:TonB-dependent receptor [Vicinamibacterales bacterium]
MMRLIALCLIVAFAFVTTPVLAHQPPQQPPPAPQPPPPDPEEEEAPPVYEEQIVVTATRIEQQLVNAPATVSVVTSDVIQSTPATNYAELLRSVPGVNIAQTSARDFNITMRGATSTLSTSQLALVDGRSLYLDFFGFVAWDLLPMNPNEIRQIEVIRGPASAVWGANAMNGVVNFISKTPRELAGNSATISLGGFDRSVKGSDADAGTMFSINATHARAIDDRWSYKISAGGYTSDAFARPTGLIPGTSTPYPEFVNQGTTQPKFDTRVDYDAPEGRYKLVFAGGYAGTEGIIHSGIGPFDMDRGVGLGYATMRYTRNALRFNVFTNILNGDATALLSFGPNGQPIPFSFNTNTYDVEIGNVNLLGTRQVVSYGGNFRYNKFDLSIAPRGTNRTEGGAYIQDEIFVNENLRLNLGARVDKFDVVEDAVFSPRVALILKPRPEHAVRLSYNKAFRSPSLINNYLDVTIVNQLNFAQLASIHPIFTQLGTFDFLVAATGNEDLREESIEAVELGYTGVINNRATLSAAVYFTKNSDEIFFTQVGRYRATNPPPGWLQRLALLGPQLPLAVLEGLPPACTSLAEPCTTGGLPSDFSYRNLGVNRNKGFELGVDAAASRAVNVFANYSLQAMPDPDFDISEVNRPPRHRVNTGFSFNNDRYIANMSVSLVDDAFFQDVLDARFHGPTEAYTQVNGAFGVRWMGDRLTTTVKVINLGNQDVQSHVFGDIIKRQVIGELRVQF